MEPPIYSAQRRTQCVLGDNTRKSRKVPGGGDHGVVSWRPEGDVGPGHFTLGSPTELSDAFSVTSFLFISTRLHLSRNSGLLHSLGNSRKQFPITGTMDWSRPGRTPEHTQSPALEGRGSKPTEGLLIPSSASRPSPPPLCPITSFGTYRKRFLLKWQQNVK